jgi:hypothetical protein
MGSSPVEGTVHFLSSPRFNLSRALGGPSPLRRRGATDLSEPIAAAAGIKLVMMHYATVRRSESAAHGAAQRTVMIQPMMGSAQSACGPPACGPAGGPTLKAAHTLAPPRNAWPSYQASTCSCLGPGGVPHAWGQGPGGSACSAYSGPGCYTYQVPRTRGRLRVHALGAGVVRVVIRAHGQESLLRAASPPSRAL